MEKKKLAVSFILSMPAALFAYVFLHEAGHTLVALCCGARITRFSVVNAYMSYEGGIFTPFTQSLLHAAGMILPIYAATLFALAYDKKKRGVFYRCFAFAFLATVAFSILAWVLLPVIGLFADLPAGDDVTKFLVSSSLHPGLVALFALALFCALAVLLLKKKVFQSYFYMIRDIMKDTSAA